MNPSTDQICHAISNVKLLLAQQDGDDSHLQRLGLAFAEFADAAKANENPTLFRGGDLLSRLLESAVTWINRFPDDAGVVKEISDFAASHVDALEEAIENEQAYATIESMIDSANAMWSDYLLVNEASSWEPEFAEDFVADDEGDFGSDPEPGEKSDIALLLGALLGGDQVTSSSSHSQDDAPAEGDCPNVDSEQEPATCAPKQVNRDSIFSDDASAVEFTSTPDDLAAADREAREELQSDREMLEAYLDDSLRCVDSMETAALQLEQSPGSKDSIRAFCRELHTLKGASATVGLSALAAHMHQLETSLEEVFADGKDANADCLFEAIDFVRLEMDRLSGKPVDPVEAKQVDPQPITPAEFGPANVMSVVPMQAGPSTSSIADVSGLGTNGDASIRIRAAHLDRLMDMLAELVVLRNRRENNASEYDLLYSELSRCSTRLSLAEEQSGRMPNSTVVEEVSKDIEAVARGFRSLQKPVANDNAAISRFIRDFRQELMHLRRVPVSGLFGRLQRAARDAAKTESKQVRVQLVGEHTGLEQEIQERLYDPLLHVVRNCVSHGIQLPENRAGAGKEETGTITLAASATAQLLVIEVRDDGNGVDYEAIRKRGIEKGLLSSGQQTSNDELANLIFHPGFSTKETASSISGRGVGMDVVATTLEQLRGRIEVESETGVGTTIRLMIPLRTGIEHVMVFRCANQLYALPMQSIVSAKKSREGFTSLSRFAFPGNEATDRSGGHVLVLKQSGLVADSPKSQISLAVDELIGPEEVVVRGLPAMIRLHPLFCGISLSGSGEKVMLLASESVADYCQPESENEKHNYEPGNSSGMRALVVDDSLTARKFVSKQLKEYGFSIVEAGDGIEAIEELHRSNFDLVVTDLDMPRLGGLQLLADIQSGQYCNSPVVVVSSRDDDSFRRQAMEFGANDYITKPVSKQRFQNLLEQLGLIAATFQG